MLRYFVFQETEF